jgi:hypothetical protein
MAIAKKKPAEPVRIDIKKEDTVKVITGRDKGKTGPRAAVNRETGKVLVEHVMMIKRHTRPNPGKQIKGGIAERESPIRLQRDGGVPGLPQGGAHGPPHRPCSRRQDAPPRARLPQVRPDARQEVRISWQHV